MNLQQWGLLIEIAGFVILSVFGSILLNRDMTLSFADRISSFLDWMNRKLVRVPNWHTLKPILKYAAKALLTISLFLLVVVGLLYDKLWLLLIGLVWLCLGLVVSALVFVLLEKKPLRRVPSHILETAINTAITPIMVVVLVVAGVGLRIFRDTIRWVAREDVPKKLLILVGTGVILIGLILQFIASI